nr:hypothetical protein [Rhodoferax sp.]
MPNSPDDGVPQLTMGELAKSLAEWRDALTLTAMALHDHQFELDFCRRVAAEQHVEEVLERIKQG